MLNLRALRYFVAIADAGSLTAAAEAVSVAQPALTRQLRELEADLGVTLLMRYPRGVRLTPAGVTLYESAQRMLAEAARVRQMLAQHQKDQPQTVVLGASPTLARVLLPGLFESAQGSVSGWTCACARPSHPRCWTGWSAAWWTWPSSPTRNRAGTCR